MFFVCTFVFAAVTFQFSDKIEDEELTLAEQTVEIEEDDEAEDGELIFDSEEIVAELDEENSRLFDY
jgi:hypothetical protein